MKPYAVASFKVTAPPDAYAVKPVELVAFNSNVFAVALATVYELLLSCVIPTTPVIVTVSPFAKV